MGLHIASPGLVLDGSAVIGTRIFPTAKDLAILALPNLKNWFRASDARLTADGLVWRDRVTGLAVSNIAAQSPAITTADGRVALDFDASGTTYLDGPASLSQTATFTTIVRMRPKAALATGVIHAGRRNGDSDGPWCYMSSAGAFLAQVRAGQQLSSAAMFAANTTVVADWTSTGTYNLAGRDGVYRGRAGMGGTPGPLADASWRVGMGTGTSTNKLTAYVFDILNFNIPLRDDNGAAVDGQIAAVLANL